MALARIRPTTQSGSKGTIALRSRAFQTGPPWILARRESSRDILIQRPRCVESLEDAKHRRSGLFAKEGLKPVTDRVVTRANRLRDRR